jgi:hypothetical protein
MWPKRAKPALSPQASPKLQVEHQNRRRHMATAFNGSLVPVTFWQWRVMHVAVSQHSRSILSDCWLTQYFCQGEASVQPKNSAVAKVLRSASEAGPFLSAAAPDTLLRQQAFF